MDKLGVNEGINEAEKLGITTLNHTTNYGLSLVLGTGEVPLLEMTGAYSVFANQGIFNPPTGIIEITNKYGKKVEEPHNILYYINPLNWFHLLNPSQAKEVMSKEAAFIISSILSDNNARAEEFGGALTISRPAAVKTGTTEDFRDALTIGYTPSLVVGVWVGNNDNTPMDNIAGSLGAAPIWRNMMEHYLLGKPIETFEKPTFVVSQLVCVPGTNYGHDEFFIAGTQPNDCSAPTPQPTLTFGPTTKPTSPTPAPTSQPQPTATPAPTTKPIFIPTATPIITLPVSPTLPLPTTPI
jgi:membrane peptidoglycan carboxypeptidase